MRIGSLFSGYSGLDLGVRAVLGGSVVWHAEVDTAASLVLAHRWPGVPNLGDITGVNWSQAAPVDVLVGGFPCQDVSSAGKRVGLRPGSRSGLWSQMAYAVSVLRPRLVVAENVRGLLSAPATSQMEPCPWCLGDHAPHAVRALGAVLGDLADLGYDAAWCGLPASAVGAPHNRFRVFVAASDTAGERHGDAWPTRRRGLSAAAVAGDLRAPARGRGSGRGDLDAHSDGAGRQGIDQEGHRNPGDAHRRGSTDWGDYTPAIRRWERRLGRPAPAPITTGHHGARVLDPAFVEWMQGAPEGWVTHVPGLSRTAMLRVLGNGVIPHQAAAALPWLLDTLAAPVEQAA
ncbi:DNA cytosine methyltransferase [Actinokineospora iranica]|uniref:DNA (cytosine-5-)-methyltransferase n=1 Tax=Actinokineospora iranica TaxID=1271860 RepID=A0A1G6Y799_9PSEU|nr:DNA cytosine methyltransferase [Actinokineospora iranica]SDD86278.1 DNA (cytosine-5)-methyltransferase 1 [Actinokineospora iranica]